MTKKSFILNSIDNFFLIITCTVLFEVLISLQDVEYNKLHLQWQKFNERVKRRKYRIKNKLLQKIRNFENSTLSHINWLQYIEKFINGCIQNENRLRDLTLYNAAVADISEDELYELEVRNLITYIYIYTIYIYTYYVYYIYYI